MKAFLWTLAGMMLVGGAKLYYDRLAVAHVSHKRNAASKRVAHPHRTGTRKHIRK